LKNINKKGERTMEKIAKSIILTIVGIILAYIVIVNFGSVLITLAIAVGAFIVLILLKTFVFDSGVLSKLNNINRKNT